MNSENKYGILHYNAAIKCEPGVFPLSKMSNIIGAAVRTKSPQEKPSWGSIMSTMWCGTAAISLGVGLFDPMLRCLYT
jgi:hypothetical protein